MKQHRRRSSGSEAADSRGPSCSLCGSSKSRLRFPDTRKQGASSGHPSSYLCTHSGYGIHPPIFECLECGFIFSRSTVSAERLLEAYSLVEDPTYLEEEEGRVLTSHRRLEKIRRWKPEPGRLLDIGAYTGVFVKTAAEFGWDAWGVEPSRWAVRCARTRGLNMIEGTVESIDAGIEPFDVVTLWDVIEHVPDPFAALAAAHRVLKPGGMVVVHTMDAGSPVARLMGSRWPWLMEMHLFYFSRRTLSDAMKRAGFEIDRVFQEGRYLRLGYLATRVGGVLRPAAGRVLGSTFRALGLAGVAIPINTGDLMTIYGSRVR